MAHQKHIDDLTGLLKQWIAQPTGISQQLAKVSADKSGSGTIEMEDEKIVKNRQRSKATNEFKNLSENDYYVISSIDLQLP